MFIITRSIYSAHCSCCDHCSLLLHRSDGMRPTTARAGAGEEKPIQFPKLVWPRKHTNIKNTRGGGGARPKDRRGPVFFRGLWRGRTAPPVELSLSRPAPSDHIMWEIIIRTGRLFILVRARRLMRLLPRWPNIYRFLICWPTVFDPFVTTNR